MSGFLPVVSQSPAYGTEGNSTYKGIRKAQGIIFSAFAAILVSFSFLIFGLAIDRAKSDRSLAQY